MQLYHHPYSMDSQRVRFALEEKGIDYTSYHVNPITGDHMDASFFKMNPNARLPVFKNGSHIILDPIEIIEYIERIAEVSSGKEYTTYNREILGWMQRIREWDAKLFTISNIPEKHRISISKFLRRVIIARMAEFPEMANTYHRKLREAYEMDERLKDPETLRRSKEHLVKLLDEVEARLRETKYLVGENFSMADVMLVPLLARLSLLDLEDEYITVRQNLSEYWVSVRERPSYKKVVGRYFNGWRKYRTLVKTWLSVKVRSLLRKY